MKTVAKFAVAAVLALSAAAPAFAGVQGEETTLLERNTYVYTPAARLISRHQDARGINALAQAPAKTLAPIERMDSRSDAERFQH